MTQKPIISIVVPLHNEADNILELHRQIIEAVKEFQHEIIYINDGSEDDTLSRLKLIHTPISIINMSNRYGQSVALLAGFHHAKAPYIVTLDGDLQNDPIDIPRMLHTIQSYAADMVIGNRKNRHDSLLKIWPSKVVNLILKNCFKLPCSDIGCGLKIMTHKLALSLPLHHGMHRFLALNAHRFGAQIIEVNINHRPRVKGVSKYNLNRIPKVIKDLILIFLEDENPKPRIDYSFTLIK